MSVIRVEDIRCFGYHGCMREEGVIGGEYLITVEVIAPGHISGGSDNLIDTVDYVAITKVVQEEMHFRSKLIEHLATRILNRLMNDFLLIEKASVIVSKLAPPIPGEVKQVSVEVQAKR